VDWQNGRHFCSFLGSGSGFLAERESQMRQIFITIYFTLTPRYPPPWS